MVRPLEGLNEGADYRPEFRPLMVILELGGSPAGIWPSAPRTNSTN
jgi:hypothetical protein